MSDPLAELAISLGATTQEIQDPKRLFHWLASYFEVYNHVKSPPLYKRMLRAVRKRYKEDGFIDRASFVNASTECLCDKMKWDLDHIAFCRSKNFYKSSKWKRVRVLALAQSNKCRACGKSPEDGVVIHVDHILPRSIYPEYALNISNLQILCEDCNIGKGNTLETRF